MYTFICLFTAQLTLRVPGQVFWSLGQIIYGAYKYSYITANKQSYQVLQIFQCNPYICETLDNAVQLRQDHSRTDRSTIAIPTQQSSVHWRHIGAGESQTSTGNGRRNPPCKKVAFGVCGSVLESSVHVGIHLVFFSIINFFMIIQICVGIVLGQHVFLCIFFQVHKVFVQCTISNKYLNKFILYLKSAD